MALDDYKIVDADYTGKDVSGLADKPTLTAAQLKARFDSLVKNVVAVRYNACIDALKTLIAGLASKVTGATNGNFAGLDADGNLTDSGKNAGDFEPLSIVRHTVYKNSLGEEWFKILSFPISERATVKISCYSSHASILQRGHWEMIINRDLDGNIRADLIYSTNVVTSKFSVRSDSGVLKLYFSTPQYTEFTILSEVIIGDATLTTYADTAETPTGTEIPVNYLDILPLLSGKEPYVKALELTGGPGYGGYIDFHYGGSTEDYTSRIIENVPGNLGISGGIDLGTPLAIASGGTGANNAADARTALGLGNSATKNVGTGADNVSAGNHTHTAADVGAATAGHTHTRSSLGFITAAGEVTVPSGQNYVDVTISGLTSSHRAIVMRTGVTLTTTGVIPQSTVCSTNNCRVYFSDDGSPTSVGLYIIATL